MDQKPICERCKKEFIYFAPARCTECNVKLFEAYRKKLEEESKVIFETNNPSKSFWYKAKDFSYLVLLYIIPMIIVGATMGIKYEWTAIAGGIHMILYSNIKDWLMEKF